MFLRLLTTFRVENNLQTSMAENNSISISSPMNRFILALIPKIFRDLLPICSFQVVQRNINLLLLLLFLQIKKLKRVQVIFPKFHRKSISEPWIILSISCKLQWRMNLLLQGNPRFLIWKVLSGSILFLTLLSVLCTHMYAMVKKTNKQTYMMNPSWNYHEQMSTLTIFLNFWWNWPYPSVGRQGKKSLVISTY